MCGFVVAGELSLVGRVRYIVGHGRQADNCHPENMSCKKQQGGQIAASAPFFCF